MASKDDSEGMEPWLRPLAPGITRDDDIDGSVSRILQMKDTISQDHGHENAAGGGMHSKDVDSDNESYVSSNDSRAVKTFPISRTRHQISSPEISHESDDEGAGFRDKLEGLLEQESNLKRGMTGILGLLQEMDTEIRLLRKELTQVKKATGMKIDPIERPEQVEPSKSTSTQDSPINDNITEDPDKIIWETFHIVYCDDGEKSQYRDKPRMFKGDTKKDHIRGLLSVENLSVYVEANPKTAFVVVYEYECDTKTKTAIFKVKVGNKNGRLIKDSDPVKHSIMHINTSPAVQRAIKQIMQTYPERFKNYNKDDIPKWFPQPYFLFYVHNKTFLELLDSSSLEPHDRDSIRLLCDWFEENCRNNWDEADDLLSRGKINRKHCSKLFRPGELVIHPGKGTEGSMRASKVKDYGWKDDYERSMEIIHWVFNGSFIGREQETTFTELISNPKAEDDDEVDITSLDLYPLRFTDETVRNKLVARGGKFWDCRKKRLIAYCDRSTEPGEQMEQRCMVDYGMYRRLHPRKALFRDSPSDEDKILTEGNESPDDDFLACLPAFIHAFNFSLKSWQLLRVDRITEVTWNKNAFRQLVASDETKELIQAMVTARGNQISASHDIIEGKGQGLLILLHGGPGTGKTLTAESIADEQERPLYRVTCGDIGIEPQEVEQYLGNVLEIGKAWGCVVLIDEADIFLEERSFQDQKRNAIISIFLRILEYYDGILILTTNRIGSFDEAFKSRIQLALGYPPLTEEDRLKIWQNFVKMLPKSKDRVDIEDLEMNLPKLARHEMNGREIRNIITMARHLAKFRKEMLRYKHMQDAVRSSQNFSKYLYEVKGKISDDDWARADKLR